MCLPALVYLVNIPRWSLDLDEIYTLRDSSAKVSEILTYEKPLYYLLCHVVLGHDFSPEVAIRLPSAIAAGAIAPVFYVMLRSMRGRRMARITALLIAANPWLFQLSQFGRFYSLMVLFASIATLSLYRAVFERRLSWGFCFVVMTILAALTHTTAVVLFPAGIAAMCVCMWCCDQGRWAELLRANWIFLLGLGAFSVVCLSYGAIDAFRGWIQAKHGQYGNYQAHQVLLGFVAFSGLQVWALAAIPLAKGWRYWSHDEVFLAVILVGTMLPFVFLAPIGGGVAPRYLLASVPPLFILAGRTWDTIASRVEGGLARTALAGALLASYVPMLASTLKDGNHCDYRSAVAYVEQLDLEHPIIACTAHDLFNFYATQDAEVHELHALADWREAPSADGSKVQRNLLRLIEQSRRFDRPLLLVSREDRRLLRTPVQEWIAERFVVLAKIEKPRFDHRRNQVVIYRYRPQ